MADGIKAIDGAIYQDISGTVCSRLDPDLDVRASGVEQCGPAEEMLERTASAPGTVSRLSNTLTVGGIPTVRLTRAEMAATMVRDCADAAAGNLKRPKLVFASNGSVIARYHSDSSFRYLVQQADIIDADGAPLVFASRFFCNLPLVERVATTDLIYDCSHAAARHAIRFYFLGGRLGVANCAADRLRSLYPGLEIVGCRDGYFDPADEHLIWRDIRQSGAQVLWLGLGSPLQERLARSWQPHLPGVAWIRTCGGLFDHVSGNVRRAPKWVQGAGLEWLHRMCLEPFRLGPRYLYSNPVAAFHLITKTNDRSRRDERAI